MSTILGIDLGSYSVKVARFEQTFRTIHLANIDEERVPEPGESPVLPGLGKGKTETSLNSEISSDEAPAIHPDDDTLTNRQARALFAILGRQKGRVESCAIGLSAGVSLRLIEMPFSDAKKVAQTLPFELASQQIEDMEGLVVDELPAGAGVGNGSLWLAGCIAKQAVVAPIAALAALGVEPRFCASTALATASLWTKNKQGNHSHDDLPLWVIDFGHTTTHVLALAAHPKRPGQVLTEFARTIPRGGLQITQALASQLQLNLAVAEKLKHEHGLSEHPQIHPIVHRAIKPLFRDLKQTLAAYASRFGYEPQKLFITGGGAALVGLSELLFAELGIAVQPLLPPEQALWLGPATRETVVGESITFGEANASRTYVSSTALVHRWPTGTAAVALGLHAIFGGTNFNFRKGPLAYRTDYALLREKAPLLVGFVVSLIVCVSFWAYASLRQLEKESDRLKQQLLTETAALFDTPKSDGKQVLAEIQALLGQDKATGQRIPSVSALDLLEEISAAAPERNAAGSARLDVLELHIRPKKADIKATCASAQYVDDFAASLSKIRCFRKVQKGKVLTLKNTGPDGKPIEVKQFALEIETTCP